MTPCSAALLARTVGLLALALAAWILPARADDRAPAAGADPFALNKRLGRGVNVLGYDPLWRDPALARFQPKHFQLIRDAGFDSVRINLHPFRDGRADENHKLSPRWFETLDAAVRDARAAGLLVVLDFHEFRALGKDPDSLTPRFLAMWRQIAEHYRQAPPEVLFELLNESNGKLHAARWNKLLREALAVVRASNPTRTVILGPAQWNHINALEKLELPDDDKNLIVTVHYYNPFPFTHQGAAWAKLGIPWDGTTADRAALARDFDKAQTWATKHHRPLYLGEFGAYDKADMPSRARWTDAVTREAERRGWSWAYWQFDGDFIVYDMKKQEWVAPIRDALLPPRK